MKQCCILNADLFSLEQHQEMKRFKCQVEIRGRKWNSKQEAERGSLQNNLHDISLQERNIDSYWSVACQSLSVPQNCWGIVQLSTGFSKAFRRKMMLEGLMDWEDKKWPASSLSICLPLFHWAVLHMPVIQLPGNRLCWATSGHQHMPCQRWAQIERSSSKPARCCVCSGKEPCCDSGDICSGTAPGSWLPGCRSRGSSRAPGWHWLCRHTRLCPQGRPPEQAASRNRGDAAGLARAGLAGGGVACVLFP